MAEFPKFMQHPANKISPSQQATPGVEGFVFDGVDGSQMAFWTCSQSAESSSRVHEFDEYMIVVEGRYTLIIEGRRIVLTAGDEYFIPHGTHHSGKCSLGHELFMHLADGGLKGQRALFEEHVLPASRMIESFR